MWNRILSCLLALAIGLAIASPILASESAPAGEVDMNPFSLSAWKTDLALWTAVVFLCLLLILTKFAWGPLAAALDKRERNIADQIAQAEAANQKAQGDPGRLRAQAGRRARAGPRHPRSGPPRRRESSATKCSTRRRRMPRPNIPRAVKQIDAATAAAIEELAGRSATLAVELAGKIVHAKLNPADHARLIEQAVAGFVQGKNDVNQN